MKKLNTWLLLSLGSSLTLLWGQSLAEWPLTSAFMGAPQGVATGVSASSFQRGNGIGSLQFGATGVSTRNWTTAPAKGPVDYVQICLTPNTDENVLITGLEFTEKRTDDGPRAYVLAYSADDFQTAVQLDSLPIPDNTSWRSYSLTGLDIRSCQGRAVCFRWYALGSESATGQWQFRNESLRLLGQVLAPCAAPAGAGAINATAAGAGSLSFSIGPAPAAQQLLIMRKGAPVTAMPCQGQAYAAHAAFGQGAALATGEYAVGLLNGGGGVATINGLEAGATYHLAVFPLNAGGCYQQNNPGRTSATLPCTAPGLTAFSLVSVANGNAGLMWTPPHCFDEVAVFASTQPISAVPSGNAVNYTASPAFGQGHPVLAPGVYPVYLGNADNAQITGLSNGTTYYARVFTRLGNEWSAGMETTFSPGIGCPELEGDPVFLNELHYDNEGDDVDEGIEIVGPAGINLASYEVALYRRVNAATCSLYRTVSLGGFIDNEGGSGFGAVWIPIPDIDNNTGAIAIYNRARKRVVQFLGYRSAMTAADGPAQGSTATLIANPSGSVQAVYETTLTPVGVSIQLTGGGNANFGSGSGMLCPSDFTWLSDLPMSLDQTNAQQLALPVSWLSFEGKLQPDGQVLLNWTTATERNNDYIAVEHSIDGRIFTEIGRRAGAGDSSAPVSYHWLHAYPKPGVNYYRLRQVDFGGAYAYQGPVAILIGEEKEGIRAFPNPCTSNLQLSWPEGSRAWSVYTAAGQQVRAGLLDGQPGAANILLEGLEPGVYWLRVEADQVVHSLRIVKVR